MSGFTAPCGHPGTPIIGTFVACTVKGCDGRPKHDQLAVDVAAALARDGVNLKWHLERPGKYPVVCVDESDDMQVGTKIATALRGIPPFYVVILCPKLVTRWVWNRCQEALTRGIKKPLFDVAKGFVDAHVTDVTRTGLPPDCIPVKAEVKHGRLGRSLEVVLNFNGKKVEHVDWL